MDFNCESSWRCLAWCTDGLPAFDHFTQYTAQRNRCLTYTHIYTHTHTDTDTHTHTDTHTEANWAALESCQHFLLYAYIYSRKGRG